MFLKGYPLEAKMHQRTETRVCIFSGLDFICDPLIVSKFHNETHDPKGQENEIYTYYICNNKIIIYMISTFL